MKKILQFLKEVKAEFHHITWPKKDTLISLTIVVISISIIISLILGAFDYLFTRSFSLLGQIKTSPETVQEVQAPEATGSIQLQVEPTQSEN